MGFRIDPGTYTKSFWAIYLAIMDAQGLLDVIEKRSQLDDAEDTEPAIWSVRFYFVSSRSEAD